MNLTLDSIEILNLIVGVYDLMKNKFLQIPFCGFALFKFKFILQNAIVADLTQQLDFLNNSLWLFAGFKYFKCVCLFLLLNSF